MEQKADSGYSLSNAITVCAQTDTTAVGPLTNSNSFRILGATADAAAPETVFLYGWRVPCDEEENRIALAIDGTVFGVIEAGASCGVAIERPDGTLPFAYPLPTAFLDGGEHRFTVAATPDGLVADDPGLVLPLPHRDPPLRKATTVAACAIVKDEARFLVEWYAHHRTLGIEHFHIYNNDSTDETGVILEILARQGDVTVRDWPSEGAHSPQVQAYNHALSTASADTEWLFCLDLDEFLVLERHARIQDLLAWHQGASAIAVNWALFGSNGLDAWENRPVTARFRRRAVQDFQVNLHVKTIARTSAAAFIGIHHAEPRQGPYVTASGRRIETADFHGIAHVIDWETARLHHYFCKSREEWALKRARGKADHALDSPDRFRNDHEFDGHDRNEEEDDTLVRRLPALAAEISRLKDACPDIAPYCPVFSTSDP